MAEPNGTAVIDEPEAGPSSPRPAKVPLPSSPPASNSNSLLNSAVLSPPLPLGRTSGESARSLGGHDDDAVSQLEAELAVVRNEKEVLSGQYRGLLGKLTAMRQSLGEKLREDAVSRESPRAATMR